MDKIININILPKDLFKKWLEITQPYHKLPDQKRDVLAMFLYYHFKLSQEVTNSKILWKILFDYDTKKLIMEELGIKDQALRNALTAFRKKHIIEDNKINPLFIPKISKKDKHFKIIYNFNIVHE